MRRGTLRTLLIAALLTPLALVSLLLNLEEQSHAEIDHDR